MVGALENSSTTNIAVNLEECGCLPCHVLHEIERDVLMRIEFRSDGLQQVIALTCAGCEFYRRQLIFLHYFDFY